MFQPTTTNPSLIMFQAMDYIDAREERFEAGMKMCFINLVLASFQGDHIDITRIAEKTSCSIQEAEEYMEYLDKAGVISLFKNNGKVYFIQNLSLIA